LGFGGQNLNTKPPSRFFAFGKKERVKNFFSKLYLCQLIEMELKKGL
jgi:hypothetical protein